MIGCKLSCIAQAHVCPSGDNAKAIESESSLSLLLTLRTAKSAFCVVRDIKAVFVTLKLRRRYNIVYGNLRTHSA